MNPEDQATVLRHTQYVARHFVSMRQPLSKITELIRHSIGTAAPAPEEIARFLRMQDTQALLEREYETAVWLSADPFKSWRVVCLAVPDNVEDAKALLARMPPQNACAFCWGQEPGWTKEILVPELDLARNPVPGVYLHKQCVRPWTLMRNMVARNG